MPRMSSSRTIGFLHTAASNETAFAALVSAASVSTQSIHEVRVDLLDRARVDINDPSLHADLRELITSLAARTDVVVCSCSTLGGLAESLATSDNVFRVDRPMARQAVAAANRIDIVVALESTIEPTLALFQDEANRQGRSPVLTIRPCLHAWDAWSAGDVELYTSLIAEHANHLFTADDGPDVVVLAQASMLGALTQVTDPSRVLCSPNLAVEEAFRLIG